MTTELIILLTFAAMIMSGILGTLPTSFLDSAPYLSARMERHISTGVGFNQGSQGEIWTDRPPQGRGNY
ncbi:MAG: hypothetical protein AB8E15_00605 [Bdellovibrionales bacterium]